MADVQFPTGPDIQTGPVPAPQNIGGPAVGTAPVRAVASWVLTAGAILSILGGVGCVLTKISNGETDFNVLAGCMTPALAGIGILSPGLSVFKAGAMSRT